jgi:hypothetical protein
LNESLVNMRNIRTSLIVGVLMVELVFGVFLLSQRGHRPQNEPDAATPTTANSGELAAVPSQSGDLHVSAGSVVGAAPLSRNTAAVAAGVDQSTGGAVVTASGQPEPPEPPANMAVQVPPLNTPAREPVAGRAYVAPKSDPVAQTGSGRDSAHRHGANPVGAALTDALVKESAKLDPALPPPQVAQPVELSRDESYHANPRNNPVAAAMTHQLVKESAKLDPGLPPPNQPTMK